MDVLPIQATSVPCERAFSSAKETMTPRRNRIAPELMEALQILKFRYKKNVLDSGGLDFTGALNPVNELRELEALQDGTPEDLSGYRSSLARDSR